MKKLLEEISKRAILLNDFDFSEEQIKLKWLGYSPATEGEIKTAEQRLNVVLPKDYVDFLKISNGFYITTNIGSFLLPVDKIDYLKVLEEDLVDIWNEHEVLKDIGDALTRSLLISDKSEQYILLIPPKTNDDKWQCWRFDKYIHEDSMFKSFNDYLKNELTFLKSLTKGVKKPITRTIIDYSLRDAVIALDWHKVFDIAARFVLEDAPFRYYNGNPDLYALMLLAAYKTNRQKEFLAFIEKVKEVIEIEQVRNDYSLQKYEVAAKSNLAFWHELQELKNFKPQSNARGLEDIEKLIERSRKDLLKPKNWVEKIDYQLYFLFDFGNMKVFITMYESSVNEQLFFSTHLKAATVYAYLNDVQKSKNAINKYQEDMFDFRPFDPYLNEMLLPILEQ